MKPGDQRYLSGTEARDAAQLAIVAALLIGQGRSRDDALREAHDLISRAQDFLLTEEMQRMQHDERLSSSLITMRQRMAVDKPSVRKYLYAVLPDNEAAEVWTQAEADPTARVFTWAVHKAMLAEQSRRRSAQQAKAAAARKASRDSER